MKTIKFKFLLPVVAFMIAIAAAFASQTDGMEDTTLQQGYILQNNVCTPHGTCTNEGDRICKDFSGQQVFGKIGSTSCVYPLYMNWHP